VKVTLCERAPRLLASPSLITWLPRPLSLFNFTHLWFQCYKRKIRCSLFRVYVSWQ